MCACVCKCVCYQFEKRNKYNNPFAWCHPERKWAFLLSVGMKRKPHFSINPDTTGVSRELDNLNSLSWSTRQMPALPHRTAGRSTQLHLHLTRSRGLIKPPMIGNVSNAQPGLSGCLLQEMRSDTSEEIRLVQGFSFPVTEAAGCRTVVLAFWGQALSFNL